MREHANKPTRIFAGGAFHGPFGYIAVVIANQRVVAPTSWNRSYDTNPSSADDVVLRGES